MGQGVAHPQEGVGKGHARHGGGVGHLFPGLRVVLAIVIGPGQVFEDGFEGAQGQAVGIIRGQHGGVGF